MKTPMQEHIEWLKKEWKKLESVGYIGVALHIGDCIEHAESMLKKEEERISGNVSKMIEYLDKQTKELVFQMTGERVNDVQHPDYQIAFYFLRKAIDFKTKER